MKLTDIKPYEKNAKRHPKRQVEQIAASIKEFGFNQPLVVDKAGVIIVGHGRYEAAKMLEMEDVPAIVVDLPPARAKAYRLADNKLNESDWDMDLVLEELKSLDDMALVDLTGFERDVLIEPDAKDDVLPSNVPQRTKPGDVYELGGHRIMCGDSTNRADMDKLMNGALADMAFTSPPYNVGHNLGYGDKKSKYASDTDNKLNYAQFIIDSTRITLDYAPEVFVNIQFLANNKKDVILWLGDLADNFKDIFFWRKTQVAPAMAENVANSATEIIALFGENNTRAWGNMKWRGDFSNFIETKSAASENRNSKIHNATFPVELPMRFILKGYLEGSIVLDPFVGTGTTLIAAQKTKRVCYGMEIEPKYVDVVVQRFVDYTGDNRIVKNDIPEEWETPRQNHDSEATTGEDE